MTKIIFVLIAIEAFRSVTDHKTVHSKGDTLETEDVNRVNNLVSRGLAKLVSVKIADAGKGGKQGGTGTVNTDKVAFDSKEYDPQVIKEALISIGIACAPNAGVKSLTGKVEALTEDQKASLAEKLSETE